MDSAPGRKRGPGSTLGHYRLLERIGAGGMGEVWRARDERLERDVALKVLLPGTIADEVTRKRFRREALALSKLNHPGIATVFDFDHEGGQDFLVMEYVSGATLSSRRGEAAHPETEVVRLGLQLAEGLAAAHAEGIVHRDLKPANLRLTADGRLKILDFGLAHLARPAGDGAGSEARTRSASMTEAGALMGTLGYMAPEQVRGEKADAKADLWAAGLVLYELATGRAGYAHAETAPLLNAILNESVVPPRKLNPRVSPALEAIILKCLEKEPEKRYDSARELAADLTRLQQGTSVAAERRRTHRRQLRTLAVAGPVAVLAVVTALDVAGLRTRLFGTASIRSIAVLPLENLSEDTSQDYFADGMTEELITQLAQVGTLRVISRTSAMAFKNTTKTIPEIARRLGADAVVEGGILRTGERIRVTAALIQARPERSLWSEQYNRDVRDVLALQSAVAQTIAARIRAHLSPAERKRLERPRAMDPLAHEAYLRGRSYVNQMDGARYQEARASFEEAIRRDSTYAPAWASLSQTFYYLSSLVLPPAEAMSRARQAARRALALDGELSEAHTALGMIEAQYDWDWKAAEADYREAIRLNPSSAEAHFFLGQELMQMRRFDEGRSEMVVARSLDPLSSFIAVGLGGLEYWAGRYDESMRLLRQVKAEHPTDVASRYLLALALARSNRHAEAMVQADSALGLGDNMYARCVRAIVYGLAGRRQIAERALQDLRANPGSGYLPPTMLAMIEAVLGRQEKALSLLERAFETRDENVLLIGIDASFDPYRSDPRFKSLLRRMDLPGG